MPTRSESEGALAHTDVPTWETIADLSKRLYKSAPPEAKRHLRPIVRREVHRRLAVSLFRRAVRAILADRSASVSAPLRAEVERWAAYNGTQARDREPAIKRIDMRLTAWEDELLSRAARRAGQPLATFVRHAALHVAERELGK